MTMPQSKTIIILMVLSSVLSSTAQAQTIKNYIDNQWKNSRYTNHNDATVTDTKTGLMWKQCVEGLTGNTCGTGTAVTTYTWKAALELASSTTFATYSDWRLPNIKELASLVARDRYSPAINSSLFPNTPSIRHWSSSPADAGGSDGAWGLNFERGVDSGDDRINDYWMRLVRGGQ